MTEFIKEVLKLDSSWEAIEKRITPTSSGAGDIEIVFASSDSKIQVSFNNAFPLEGMVELIDIENVHVLKKSENGEAFYNARFTGDVNHEFNCLNFKVNKMYRDRTPHH